MSRTSLLSCLLAACLAVAPFTHAGESTVLSAARIHTLDPAMPVVEALAFDADGKILAVGDVASLRKQFPDAASLEFPDATVVPGLIDAHGHLPNLGLFLQRADLTGTASKAEIIARLQAFEKTLGKDEWLLGRGWDQNDWDIKEFPTAADLDAAFPTRPVWIERIDGHAYWGNSAALKTSPRTLAGDWQPDGGQIVRDAKGQPTGIFVDNAIGLIEGQVPALDWVCKNGLYHHPGGRLDMRSLKLYADGALGSRGAAMIEDYSDQHGHRGLMVTSADELERISRKAQGCGVQVGTHAIGDRGNRVVLDAYQKVLGDESATLDHRWRIEHAQVVAVEDIPRFGKMHVIAAMQPTHATSDMPWAETRVGPERIAGAYAWRQMLDGGARLALGSDFPVESVDPRLGLHAAVTRTDLDGKPPGGWRSQEKLTREEALRGFTLDAAYAGFAEDDVGSLEVGKRADFVVLGADPLAEDVPLATLPVKATYVDGKAVFEAQ